MKLLNLSLFLFSLILSAQEIDLKWSEKSKSNGLMGYVGENKGMYYTIIRDKSQLKYRVYDSNMVLKSEKPTELNFVDKAEYKNRNVTKDKIIHLSTIHNKKEDKYIFYVTTTDYDLNTIGESRILFEYSDKENLRTTFITSPDSTKVLLLIEEANFYLKPRAISYKVYNNELSELLLDKKVEMTTDYKKRTTKSAKIDNFGNVHLLTKIEKSKNQKDESEYYYKIISHSFAGGGIKEFDFDFPNKDIESIEIKVDKNNTLYCSGFLKGLFKGIYSDNSKTLISDDMFHSVIDCNTLNLKFSNKFNLKDLYSNKLQNVEDNSPYTVKNIFTKTDGSSLVIAEQFKEVDYSKVNYKGAQGTGTSYYYCDIAAIKLNKSAQVETVTRIPKFQWNMTNPSILTTSHNGSTYIIYEDLEKNLNSFADENIERSRTNYFSSDKDKSLFLLKITPTGEIKKQIILSYKDSKIRPIIMYSVVVSENKILLMAQDYIGILNIK